MEGPSAVDSAEEGSKADRHENGQSNSDNNGDADQENGLDHERVASVIPAMGVEQDVFNPSGVPDPPDAIRPPPPSNRNKRVLYCALGAYLVLLTIAVIAVIVIVLQNDSTSSDNENQSPAYYREQEIKEQVQAIVGPEVLQDGRSPYSKALQWITYNDIMQTAPNSSTFLQRYFMAYFYYATSVERPWRSCNPPNVQAGQDSVCMWDKLYFISVDGKLSFAPKPSIRWLSEKPECEWMGVQCDDLTQIRSIDLAAMNLTGSFPEGIQYFPFIQTLNVAYGGLQGSLPAVIGSMNNLVSLELNGNALSGTVPTEIGASPSLQFFNVAANQLTGTIPSEIGALRDLRLLDLSTNRMAGTIPVETCNLRDMHTFNLYENRLTGTMPSEVGLLQNVRRLQWQSNNLTGQLPSSLGQMRNLTYFLLNENGFTGTIPTDWSGAKSLSDVQLQNNRRLGGTIPEGLYSVFSFRLALDNCNLTGTISEAITNMTTLNKFLVENNRLFGQLPTDWSKMTRLTDFSITGNDITGSIPPILCQMRSTQPLTNLEADCLIPSDGSAPEISCDSDNCCTVCCDAAGQECVNKKVNKK